MSPAEIEVWSDIACPWAHAAVSRLHRTRTRLGLEDRIVFRHRCFPLELVNDRPTPKRVLDAEIPVVGAIDPDAGWQLWAGDAATWPVTSLPALEAVQAATVALGLRAAETLDRALRRAFFAESRCISLRTVVLAIVRECGLDVDAVTGALDDGRRAVLADYASIGNRGVKGSPHVMLPDGSDAANPGIRMHWHGEHGVGFPVVDEDDPAIYERMLKAAAGT